MAYTSSVVLLLVAFLCTSAGFAASFQQLLRSSRHVAATSSPAHFAPRPAIAAVRLMAAEDDEGEAESVEAEAEVVDDAAAEEKPAEKEEEEEEEEDDLLSTPAFLKQKLKVLEKEMAEVEVKKVEAQAEAEAMAADWVDKRARLQGDFDNFKARHVNQTLEAQVEARIKLLQDFLPVLDNFDRARGSISPEGSAQEAVNEKYQKMHAGLMATLAELGMETVPTVGVEFDYNLHNAIQQIPSDEYEEGIVSSEMQPGFMVKGTLVRAAYVTVSSGPM